MKLVNKDNIVALAAFIGIFLSIYNFVIERRKRSVRLKVIPKTTRQMVQSQTTGGRFIVTSDSRFSLKDSNQYIAIEIINLSYFAVTIDEVGFHVKGKKDRLILPQPITGDQKEWPRKLEPRDTVTVYGQFAELFNQSDAGQIKNAYAETACGEIKKGTSKALKSLTKFIKTNT